MLSLASCAATVSAPAHAEADSQTFIAKVDAGNTVMLLVLDAFAYGMSWSNGAVVAKNQKPLFCLPEKLGMTPEKNLEILRRYVASHPEMAGERFSLTMLKAYEATFPCLPATSAER